MLLKSLEIQGFKSFPDKTKITFNQGLTAVVGPNGSGKSNISDAIRWVMGEQSTKTLRGGKMEDVIFSGTATRKPQGSATVSLSFDNTDRTLAVESDEVTITRKYYRSGDSEYLINGSPVRLRDLNELFMDTGLGRDGYAMIGQGRIAEIVSAKSKERREIFEEAAGIAKFRFRRAEAERKLEQAQENLLRLYDILNELESRVGPLREQSEKAAAFLRLSEEKRTLEVSLWLKTLERYRTTLQEQENRWLIAKGDEERLAAEADQIENAIREAAEQMQACLVKSDEYGRIKENLQNRMAQLKAETAVRENELRHTTEELSRLDDELKQQQQSAAQSGQAAKQKEALARQLEKELAEAEERLADKRQELAQLARQGEDADQRLDALTAEGNQIALDLSRLNLLMVTLQNGITDEQARLAQSEQETAALEAQLSSEAETMEGIQGLLEEIAGRKDALENTIRGYEMKQQSRQSRYDQMQQKHQALELTRREKLQRAGLLEDLERNLEGFAHSVRAVMRWKQNQSQRGIHGTVASLLTVPDQYATAIETALGGSLQNIVVADEQVAKACIRRLQQEKAGRATFLPLTSVKGNLLRENGLEDCSGFVGLASQLVQCDLEYQGVLRFLLGRIAVAEDLDAAAALAKKFGYRFRVVTLDGQQVNAGGSFTGGSAVREQGILSRKNEIQRLRTEAGKVEQEQQELAGKAGELLAELGRLKAQIEGARSELVVAGEDAIRFSADQKRYEMNRAQLNQRREQLAVQRAQSEEKIASARQQIAGAKEEIATLTARQEALQRQLAEDQGDQTALSRQREALSEAISQAALKMALLQKDLEGARRDAEDLLKQQSGQKDRTAQLMKRQEELKVTAEELRLSGERLTAEEQDALRQVGEYDERITQVLARRQEIEGETTRLRQEAREASARKEQAAGQLARLDEQKLSAQKDYDSIIQKLWEEYELTRSEAVAIAQPLPDPAEAAKELAALKNRIRSLGTVNLSAIEEYREVSGRYEFLKKQVEDAAHSRDELLNLIRDLTREMERIFRESFDRINRHFGEIFRSLFGGGNASLQLEDEEDVLNCGIEILVQPPGKIIKNLAALSGGEQSFVAIAIYFAILQVRPSPFCVLDEIEAALDDVNVTRYAAYLREICGNTQFILITHRRGTMEEADVLYGVTMQEQGVSKLLELKVTELAASFSDTAQS